MNRWWKTFLVCMMGWMMTIGAWAEETAKPASDLGQGSQSSATVASPTVPMEQIPHWSIIYLGAAASSGVIILGAAYGISKIGTSAVESMARQPEAANAINTAMVVSAALIEGVTFLALIVCLLSVFFK